MATLTGSKGGSMFVPKAFTYGAIMKSHKTIVENFEETILKYAEASIREIHTKQITIADFGTADGEIGLSILEKLIKLIRKSKDDIEIQVVFEDKEDNDYNALFGTVLKAKPLLPSGIFVMASATTMYRQCLPSNSTQFITSFHCIHYLSKRPCLVKSSMLTSNCSPDEQKLYKQQAADDWKVFLKHRSKELQNGGLLFIMSCEKYPDLGQLDVALRSMFKDKMISEREFVNISFQSYNRTTTEYQQPFEDLAEEVEDLEILCMDVFTNVMLEVGSGIIGRQLATTITAMTRTWSYYAIVDNLKKDRTDEERQLIVNEFYKRYLELVEVMTGDFCYTTRRIIIRKKIITK